MTGRRERTAAERAGPLLSWSGVGLVLAGVLSLVLGLVASSHGGPRPPFLMGEAESVPLGRVEPHVHAADLIHVAGSGSNLPLTRILADAFTERHGGRIVVYESIGSSGAVRAVHDGVVELGLVSRPLRDDERDLGLHVVPYARTPVVVAANASVPDEDITLDRLIRIYGGEETTWSDGSHIVVLQRERGDSSHAAIAAIRPEFDEVNDAAYRADRWRVLHTDASMQEALVGTPGAIGLYGQGRIDPQLPIKALRLAGVTATVGHLRDGSYPLAKDFAFVTRGPPSGLVAELLDFVASADGRAIALEHGYLPLEQGGT